MPRKSLFLSSIESLHRLPDFVHAIDDTALIVEAEVRQKTGEVTVSARR